MTIAEAQGLLNKRLKFGDSDQLAALRYLRAVSQAREKVCHCKHCHSFGFNRRGKLCEWCAAGYPEDVLAAIGVREEANGKLKFEVSESQTTPNP
jgi:hypothetical protein